MNETPSHVDPAHFLRSFLVVAFYYVMLFFGLLMGMMFIARLRFPDVFRLWTLSEEDRDEFRQAWESQPELLFPTELCVWLVVLAVILSSLIGFLVAWGAPFSKAGHGIFLAIISICTFLQISMTQPQIPKWMLMAMLVLSPSLIVIASNFGERWLSRKDGVLNQAGDAS